MDAHGRGRCSSGTQNEEEMDLRRGPWTMEEDLTLVNYIANHGEGRWNSVARCAGLKRTGKSCRLRWLNYLRPDVRRGNITPEEQLLILELHSRWGNRWYKIAQNLPGRTDNEIKNYWRTRVQKHAKQLKFDVNRKQFKDTMRYLWMPRLMERIRAAPAASGGNHNATATHQNPPAGQTLSPGCSFGVPKVWQLPESAEVMPESEKTGIEMFRSEDQIMRIQGLIQSGGDLGHVAKASLGTNEPDQEDWEYVKQKEKRKRNNISTSTATFFLFFLILISGVIEGATRPLEGERSSFQKAPITPSAASPCSHSFPGNGDCPHQAQRPREPIEVMTRPREGERSSFQKAPIIPSAASPCSSSSPGSGDCPPSK